MYKEGKGIKQDDFKALKYKSKIRATTAIIQITRLLVKLDCLEIIVKRVLNVLILGLNMLQVKMLSKMISRRSSFTKRRVI
jgi:hypothetical protein